MNEVKRPRKPKKKQYTQEQIINYVFLYHFRYKDNMSALIRESAVEVGVEEFKGWKKKYLDKAINIMMENYNFPNASESYVPTIGELIDKTTKKLDNIIDKANNPEKLTSALHKLYAIQKDKQSEDVHETDEDVYREINDNLEEQFGMDTKELTKTTEEQQ